MVGGREFVIDTSRNGADRPGQPGRDDEWRNPKRQAVGEAPRPVTDRPGLAALLYQGAGSPMCAAASRTSSRPPRPVP